MRAKGFKARLVKSPANKANMSHHGGQLRMFVSYVFQKFLIWIIQIRDGMVTSLFSNQNYFNPIL